MKDWSFVYEGFDPRQERLREALCTLGNGYFATRGAAPESDADAVHYPGTYLAGGYNRLKTEIEGKIIENEDLVNMPNWLSLKFRLDGGEWFDLQRVEILSYRQELDLRQGILLRAIHFRNGQGFETRLTDRRLVHMRDPHLAALETTIHAENWSGRIEIRSALDGQVVNAGVERYRALNSKHLIPLETEWVDADTIYLKVQTSQSEIRITQAARTRVFWGDEPLPVERRTFLEPGYIAHQFSVDVSEGNSITIEKVVALYTSRDYAISECGLQAREAVARVKRFQELLESHALAWNQIWRRFDTEIMHRVTDPKPESTAPILRLHIFHLLQIASPHIMDLDVGVPARGLHGEAYRGHIFWDELFIFSFLNFSVPEITRSLLQYRYRRLDAARAAALEAGYSGAMYPWQSSSSGREESQRIHLNPKSGHWILDNSRLQRHVNAAIAYNIWQYYQVTRDLEFLSFYGAEMILEIARFWGSIATYNEDLGRYEILGVMGPDEYHDAYPDSDRPGLNNNAYTNLMATWVLCRALEVLELLPQERRQELCKTLKLREEELRHWDEISRKMRLVFHGDGILSQFDGYEQLEEFDWEGYRTKYGDIQRIDRILEAQEDTPNRYKMSKQADVLMLFYLFSSEELGEVFRRLGYPFEYETIPKNINYYIRRTSHGSTLSRIIHSWVMARLDRERSWKLFRKALMSDVADVQGGTTPEGIHLGAMAGTVDMIQRGYTGLEPRTGVLWLNPCLPEEIEKLRLSIHYCGKSLDLEMTHNQLLVRAADTTPGSIQIGFKGQVYEIENGMAKEFAL